MFSNFSLQKYSEIGPAKKVRVCVEIHYFGPNILTPITIGPNNSEVDFYCRSKHLRIFSFLSFHGLFTEFVFSSQLTEESEKNVSKSRALLDGIIRENKGRPSKTRLTLLRNSYLTFCVNLCM